MLLNTKELIRGHKNDIIYYYNAKYPYYGIDELEVKEELYLISSKGFKAKILGVQYLVSDYNLSYGAKNKTEYENWISVYTSYDDEEIFRHDENNSYYLMSYNKDKLSELYKQTVRSKEEVLRKDLNKIEELKKDGII